MDLCVLGYDGVLTTYLADTYELADIIAQNPYQVWCFGPALITDDGGIPESYNSTASLKREHPRSAVGSDGPGHYIFLVADGRRPTYSSGFNFEGLSEFFLDLGCTVAYNLDGGRTAVMATRDGLVSVPIEPQRPVSDILYIAAP
jgi:exopolysaccharide biosynthesis protein